MRRTKLAKPTHTEEFPHLRHAPITEAVIDFRARTPAETNLQAFASLAHLLGEDYGPSKDINLLEFGVEQPPGKKPEARQIDHGRIGYRYDSKDGRQVVQFRKDGLTFSRLAPYTNWQQVFGEASRLYQLYVRTCQPEEITRIAVRYINRLLLPEAQLKDLSEFLASPPNVPKSVTVRLTGFLTHLQVEDPDTLISGTITQTVQPSNVETGKIAVIVDLDIYESKANSPNPDSVLPRFETLRRLKNRYFFSSITEKTIKLYR